MVLDIERYEIGVMHDTRESLTAERVRFHRLTYRQAFVNIDLEDEYKKGKHLRGPTIDIYTRIWTHTCQSLNAAHTYRHAKLSASPIRELSFSVNG